MTDAEVKAWCNDILDWAPRDNADEIALAVLALIVKKETAEAKVAEAERQRDEANRRLEEEIQMVSRQAKRASEAESREEALRVALAAGKGHA